MTTSALHCHVLGSTPPLIGLPPQRSSCSNGRFSSCDATSDTESRGRHPNHHLHDKREGQQSVCALLACTWRAHCAPASEYTSMGHSDVHEPRRPSYIERYESAMRLSELMQSDAVLQTVAEQAAHNVEEDEMREPPSKRQKALQVDAKMALSLFFRIVKSLQTNNNVRGLMRVAHQLPQLLAGMPPTALCGKHVHNIPAGQPVTGAAGSQSTDDVLDSVANVLSSLYHQLPQLEDNGDHSAVLTSIVALAVKRGDRRHLLEAVKLLLMYGAPDGPPGPPVSLPIKPFLKDLESIAPDHLSTAELTELAMGPRDGRGFLMTFGKGDYGKLGHGTSCEDKLEPTWVEAVRGVELRRIESLSTHSLAVTSVGGRLLSWGNGDRHRLGHGLSSRQCMPKLVNALLDKPAVVDVACGLGHTVVLLQDGQVYSWGNGGHGRLGLGDMSDRQTASPVTALQPHAVCRVFCGASHSMALTRDRQVLSWGKNNQGQCGVAGQSDVLTPRVVPTFGTEAGAVVVALAGGWEHTLACTTDGKAFSFGSGYLDNKRGVVPPVLGHGDSTPQSSPSPIAALDGVRIVDVQCGWDHSLALSASGELYTWGSGQHSKLGHGGDEDEALPKRVEALVGKHVVMAKAGCEHTVIVTSEGHLYTWGHADDGRLGHGDVEPVSLPKRVEALVEQGLAVESLAVGDKYNMVLVKYPAKQADEAAPARAWSQGAPTGGDIPQTRSEILQAVRSSLEDGGAPDSLTAATLIIVQLERIADLSDAPTEGRVVIAIMQRLLRFSTTNGSAWNGLTALRHITEVASDMHRLRKLLRRRSMAIEASYVTLELLLDILRICLRGLRGATRDHNLTRSNSSSHNTSTELDEDANVKQRSNGNIQGPHCAESCMSSGVGCVLLWCCLRLLRANMEALLAQMLVAETAQAPNAVLGNEADAKGAKETPKQSTTIQEPASAWAQHHRQHNAHNAASSYASAACTMPARPRSMRDLLHEVQKLMEEICSLGSLPSSPSIESTGLSFVKCQFEAAAVLGAGLLVFYPTVAARLALLESFLESREPDPIISTVLANKLLAEEAVTPVIAHLLDEQQPRIGGTVSALDSILERLVAHCSRGGTSTALFTRILLVLQHHALRMWVFRGTQDGERSCSRISGVLNRHFGRLVDAAVRAATLKGEAALLLDPTVLKHLLVGLHALPDERLAFFMPQLPLLFELMHALKGHERMSQAPSAAGDMPDLRRSSCRLVGRMVSNLMLCQPWAEDNLPFIGWTAKSRLFSSTLVHQWLQSDSDGGPTLVPPTEQNLVDTVARITAWQAKLSGTQPHGTACSRGPPNAQRRVERAVPVMDRPLLGGPLSPPHRHRSWSGPAELQEIVSTEELEAFLKDTVDGTCKAAELDQHMRVTTQYLSSHATDSWSDTESPSFTPLRRRKSSVESMDILTAAAEHDSLLDAIRRKVIAVLLRSHGAVQQAALLSRCLPQTAAARGSMASTSSPLLEAIWRTASAICTLLSQSFEKDAEAGDEDACSHRHQASGLGCVDSNASWLLRGSPLPPVSLLQEDFASVLEKRVKKWARANPRSSQHSSMIHQLLLTVHVWRLRFDREQANRSFEQDDAFLDLCKETVGVIQHAVPLGDFLGLLCLPCVQRRELLKTLGRMRLHARANVLSVELMGHVLSEFADEVHLCHFLEAVVRNAFGGPEGSTLEPSPVRAPTAEPAVLRCAPARGVFGSDDSRLQSASSYLNRRMVEFLRESREKPEVAVHILFVLATTILTEPEELQHQSQRLQSNAAEQKGADTIRCGCRLTAVASRLTSVLSGLLGKDGDILDKDCVTASEVMREWFTSTPPSSDQYCVTTQLGVLRREILSQMRLDDAPRCRREAESVLGSLPSENKPCRLSRSIVHDATWVVVRLLVSRLKEVRDDAAREQEGKASAAMSRAASERVVLRASSSSSAGLNSSSDRPGLTKAGSTSALGGSEIASRWKYATTGGAPSALLELLSGELHRVLPALTSLLERESGLLQAYMDAEATLILQTPRDYSAGATSIGSKHGGLVSRHMNVSDECNKSFSVGFWLYIDPTYQGHPSPSFNSYSATVPATSASGRQTESVLLARPIEVGLPTQAESERQLLDRCHPSVSLLETWDNPSQDLPRLGLQFTTLATTLEGVPPPESARAGMQSARSRVHRRSRTGSVVPEGLGPGVVPVDPAPLQSTRVGTGFAVGELFDGASAAAREPARDTRIEEHRVEITAGSAHYDPRNSARTPARKCRKDHVCTSDGWEVPRGKWVHICCVYSWDSGTSKASMQIMVEGTLVATSRVTSPLAPPLCSDVVLLRQENIAHASVGATTQSPKCHGPLVVDACFFQRSLTVEEVKAIVVSGSYSMLLLQRRRANDYASRLVTAVKEMLANPSCMKECARFDWAFLFMRLLKIGDDAVRRSVLQLYECLLRTVLGHAHPKAVVSAPSVAGSQHKLLQEEVVSQLVLTYSTLKLLPYVLNDVSAWLPPEQKMDDRLCMSMRTKCLRERFLRACDGGAGATNFSELSDAASDLLALLRGLWRAPYWHETLLAQVGKGLPKLTSWLQDVSSVGPTVRSYPNAALGALLPLEATVALLISDIFGGRRRAAPNSESSASQRDDRLEIIEGPPIPDDLHIRLLQAVLPVKPTLQPLKCAAADNDREAVLALLLFVLQTQLLQSIHRRLRPTSKKEEHLAHIILGEQVLPDLLSLAAVNVQAVMACHEEVGSVLASMCTLVSRMDLDALSDEEFEAYAARAWERWNRVRLTTCPSKSPSSGAKRNNYSLTCLGGQVAIDGCRVRSLAHFPTVRLLGVSLPVDGGGRWYFEVILLTDGLMQIGWADQDFRCDPRSGRGVGDHAHSWSYDGFRQKKWNVSSSPYGKRWHPGDVLGVLLDLDLVEMSYFLNGSDLGAAFTGFTSHSPSSAGPTQRLYPAASLNMGQAARFNFQAPFLYPPSTIDGLPFNAVADSVSADGGDLASAFYSVSSQGSAPSARQQPGGRSSREERSSRRRFTVEDEDGATYTALGMHTRRRSLMDSLTGMGFPIDWAMRAVEHCDSSLSESAAISWIINQMEMENANLEAEVESLGRAQAMHNSNEDEEDQEGDDAAQSGRSQRESRTMTEDTADTSESGVYRRFPRSSTLDDLPPRPFRRRSTVSTRYSQQTPTTTSEEAATEARDIFDRESYLSFDGSWPMCRASHAQTTPFTDTPAWKSMREEACDAPSTPQPLWRKVLDLYLNETELLILCLNAHMTLTVRYARNITTAAFAYITVPALCVRTIGDATAQLPGAIAAGRYDGGARATYPTRDVFPDVFGLATLVTVSSAEPRCSTKAVGLILRSLTTSRACADAITMWKSLLISSAGSCKHATGVQTALSTLSVARRTLSIGGDTFVVAGSNRALELSRLVLTALLLHPAVSQPHGPQSTDRQELSGASLRLYQALVGEVTAGLDALSQVRPASGEVKPLDLTPRPGGPSSARQRQQRETDAIQDQLWFLTLVWHVLLALPRLVKSALHVDHKPREGVDASLIRTLKTGIPPELLHRVLTHAVDSDNLTVSHAMLGLCHAALTELGTSPTCKAEMLEYLPESKERALLQLLHARLRHESSERIFHSSYLQQLVSVLVQWHACKAAASDDPYDSPYGGYPLAEASSRIYGSPSDHADLCLGVLIDEASTTSVTLSWGHGPSAPPPASEKSSGRYVLLLSPANAHAADPPQIRRDVQFTGEHTFADLQRHTSYRVRLAVVQHHVDREDAELCLHKALSRSPMVTGGVILGPVTWVTTGTERVLMLNPEARGANLTMLNSNMTVKNTVNKKWSTARAMPGFTSGVQQWEIRIDRCVSKNVFIGVATAESCLDNYVGSDKFGWGYLANRAVWHAKSKVRSYGELFKEGDSIGVQLNVDTGSLSFSRNGRSLGVAVEGLPTHGIELFPAISLYNKDDQLSLVAVDSNPLASSSAAFGGSGTATAESAIRNMCHLLTLLRHLPCSDTSTTADAAVPTKMPQSALLHVWHRWRRWQQGAQTRFVYTANGDAVEVDQSPVACRAFGGLHAGDHVDTAQGTATVLGASEHKLWYKVEGLPGASTWSRRAVRDLLQAGSVTPTASVRELRRELTSTLRSVSVDVLTDDCDPSEMAQWLDLWTAEMDEELCRFACEMVDMKALPPESLLFEHFNEAPLPDSYPTLSEVPLNQIRARVALLMHINATLTPLLPLLDFGPLEEQSLFGAAGTPAFAVTQSRFRLFTQTKVVLLKKLLEHSLVAAKKAGSCDHGGSSGRRTCVDRPLIKVMSQGSPSGGTDTIWSQVAAQLQHVTPLNLLQHCRRTTSCAEVERAFDVEWAHKSQDPITQYRSLFDHLACDLASAKVGLFVLEDGHVEKEGTSQQVGLVPRLACMAPDGSTPGALGMEAALRQFHTVGILIGLALRTSTPFPLHLSDHVWGLLVGSNRPVTDGSPLAASFVSDCRTILHPREVVVGLQRLSSMGVTAETMASLLPEGVRLVMPIDGKTDNCTLVEGIGSTAPTALHGAVCRIGATTGHSTMTVTPLQTATHAVELTPDSALRHARLMEAVQVTGLAIPGMAMFKGFTSVVPVHALPLMTARELKDLVVGDRILPSDTFWARPADEPVSRDERSSGVDDNDGEGDLAEDSVS